MRFMITFTWILILDQMLIYVISSMGGPAYDVVKRVILGVVLAVVIIYRMKYILRDIKHMTH